MALLKNKTRTILWGANADDWMLFDTQLNLTDDLLPVVSNPHATISKQSKMKALGKTPSRYNGMRHAVGIPDWTSKRASLEEVVQWELEPDYGICIQTRHLRALDIDVADPAKSKAIADYIAMRIGRPVPIRRRSDSGKCLAAFMVQGVLAKRILQVSGGMIEFLGNGQQFIAAGTHTGGRRYEWVWPIVEGHEDRSFFELSMDEWESLWASLVAKFGTAEAVYSNTERKRGAYIELLDPVATELEALGYGKDGQIYIRCPFEADHSSDTGIAQTCYFPAGTRGYEQGHFHCLHAHCRSRTESDFLDALGLRCTEFAELEPITVKSATGDVEVQEPLPPLQRKKDGRAKATVSNVHAILKRMDVCGFKVGLDSFKDDIMYQRKGTNTWALFKDNDYTKLREMFDELNFDPVGRELVRDVVALVANENQFDSAQTWLESLEWDGVERIETFCPAYLKTENNLYTRQAGLYMWTALAGRVMEPGIKADMVPIFVGAQGIGKSTAVRAIVPVEDCFTEVSFGERDDDLARRMRGKLLAEIGELRGLHTKELESIKAFVTRTHEDWVPKFKEFSTSYPRRMLFIGTTNSDEFLNDPTGNRRWLPLKVGVDFSLQPKSAKNSKIENDSKKSPDLSSRSMCDVPAIQRDRDQLWAEARERFLSGSIQYTQAEELAAPVQEQFQMRDAWVDAVRDWLHAPDVDGASVIERHEKAGAGAPPLMLRSVDVLRGAIGVPLDRIGRKEENRMAGVLKGLGFDGDMVEVGGKRLRVWVLRDKSKV